MRDVVLLLEGVEDADELRGQAGAYFLGDTLWDSTIECLGHRACDGGLCVGVTAQSNCAAHRAFEGHGGQRADERLGYRPLARLVERAGWLDVVVGTVQVIPKSSLEHVPDDNLTGPLAGKENGSRRGLSTLDTLRMVVGHLG